MQTAQTTATPVRQNDALLTGKQPWLRLLPEDGWLTLALLLVVVYTTIASIQSVTPPWAPGLGILTATTGIGLLLGYLAVQQGRLPGALVHTVAIILGILFAFQATANEVLNGDRGALLSHTQVWFQSAVLQHNTSNDNTVFLLFLAILSFLLAYISIWLVLHTRRPWLAALANGVVLLINLNWATDDKSVFFIILFLLATLLLLVRFTLAENVRVWRLRGLRFSPDLGWDFMQAGAIFAVIVLTLANILPAGAGNANLLNAWNSSKNPWQAVQTTFQNMFSGLQGGKGNSGGESFNFFTQNLTLTNETKLPDTPILTYATGAGDDASQYLVTETFDQYDGVGTWSASPTQQSSMQPNQLQPLVPDNSQYFKINTYEITLDQVPSNSPMFAPGSAAESFSIASQTSISTATGIPVKWTATNDEKRGLKYFASAYISTATAAQLQSVPYPPAQESGVTSPQYPLGLLQQYLYSTPKGEIPFLAVKDATQYTSGTTNMYDAAMAIQNYLHTFRYSTSVPPPQNGTDPVTWFLQQQVGFCTHFATAMVLMARSLGMPARIAEGFSNGSYDSRTNTWVVTGKQAHVWPQIYFGQYGWINFEPTSGGFSGFIRPISNTNLTATTGPGSNGSATPQSTPRGVGVRPGANGGGLHNNGAQANPVLLDAGLVVSLLIIFALLAFVFFTSWWRLLYRGLSPVAAAFARIARLGAWAGAPPKRSQTPDEYVEQLGRVIPGQRLALQRLSGLYARERWGGGLSNEAAGEVPRLYGEVRTSITRQMLQRLRALPVTMFTAIRRLLVGKDEYNGARTPLRRR